MEINELFHDKYILKKDLGGGAATEVWMAIGVDVNIQVALKIFVKSSDAILNALNQWFQFARKIDNKNIIVPLDFDMCDDKPYFVLPYCKNGDISKDVGKFTEKRIWKLLYDVANGLVWLHNMNPQIVHQGLTPLNILETDCNGFAITDFCLKPIVITTYDAIKLMWTTPRYARYTYIAPELCKRNAVPIAASDIYSLGAILFEMITGDPPFGDDGGFLQLMGADVSGLEDACSSQLKLVIERCLNVNPQERPTAKQLRNYAELALTGEFDFLEKTIQ